MLTFKSCSPRLGSQVKQVGLLWRRLETEGCIFPGRRTWRASCRKLSPRPARQSRALQPPQRPLRLCASSKRTPEFVVSPACCAYAHSAWVLSHRHTIHAISVLCRHFRASLHCLFENGASLQPIASDTGHVLCARVGVLFDEAACNTPAVKGLLGISGVQDTNLLQYLGIIEQRAHELLQVLLSA